MALPDFSKRSVGTTKTIRASGGDAAMTMASLANNAARQCVKLNLGANRAPAYRLVTEHEYAATPTAGAETEYYGGWSNSATAGTDNPGGLSGTDAAYTGQSSNLDASCRQLAYLGSAVNNGIPTATGFQRTEVGIVIPRGRYLCLAVYNKSGAAFHSSDTNQAIYLIPIEESIEDTV